MSQEDTAVNGGEVNAGQLAARTAALDLLDRRIIALLQLDGRCSNREMARQLGVPEATVRYRVRRLTDGGMLRITALVEPEMLGYQLTTVISIQTEANRVEEVAARLAGYPEVMCLMITTGVYDIVFTAAFQDQAGLYCFLTNYLSQIPGIIRSDSAIGLRVVKRDHEWASELTTALADAESER